MDKKIFINGIITAVFISATVMQPVYLFAEIVRDVITSEDMSKIDIPVKVFCGIEMVLCPEGKIHKFWISRYEVTQVIYKSVMGVNPSYFNGENLPVEQVSWFNAVEFCNRLSIRGGLKPYYNIDKTREDPENKNIGIRWVVTVNADANGFRLPLSVEWEYAARAGSTWKFFWGDRVNGDFCWCRDNSGGRTHPVGEKNPNAWGIYDICGNVSEWCFDWHPLYYGLYRVIRSGHYNLKEEEMSLDRIDYRAPQLEFGFTGFRLVKNGR
jgi:formylglycine-generating enzyme required for sulfatase activity